MTNRLFLLDRELMYDIKEGRCRFFIDDIGEKHLAGELRRGVKIMCNICQKKCDVKFYPNIMKRVYLCASCRSKGEKNSFYGKKHSQEFKDKLRNERKGKRLNPYSKSFYQWWVEKYGEEKAKCLLEELSKKKREIFKGEKNPFFGKHHNDATKIKIRRANRKWLESLSKQEKEKHSKKCREAQYRIFLRNPQEYIDNKKKAARISASNGVKYKQNKIEKIVSQELKNRNLDFKYSVILDRKQFDFGNRQHRILLEVQGDYWHANPTMYNMDNLTRAQRKNKLRDLNKKKFAEEHNFRLFYIWENDINCLNFKVLDEIKRCFNEV